MAALGPSAVVTSGMAASSLAVPRPLVSSHGGVTLRAPIGREQYGVVISRVSLAENRLYSPPLGALWLPVPHYGDRDERIQARELDSTWMVRCTVAGGSLLHRISRVNVLWGCISRAGGPGPFHGRKIRKQKGSA